ncbi:esterase/lipase family protein [Nocardia spumae]|uniref:esterase/lipase family protein n=1 Tax=Nocardia spumae TaxID=2887190 RepID=UPI001D140350|nr:alpha/beta fold hydrolase [Nocardia spumae]
MNSMVRFAVATAAGLAAAIFSIGPGACLAAPIESTPPAGPVQHSWPEALVYSHQHPEVFAEGMNDWSCRPDAAHPHPVILMHGALSNAYANWSMFSPRMKAAGYCVFGLNYGGAQDSPIQGSGNMRGGAGQLAVFVDQVLAATSADKVDIVGHSEGGIVPLYYINKLGGADKVHAMIGLEPATNGIDVYHLAPLVSDVPFLRFLQAVYVPAGRDGTAGSKFVQEIGEGGMTRPQVHYTTIISRSDLVITVPEAQLPPAPNVTNVVTQDVCPKSGTTHTGAIYDEISLRLVLNALDPSTSATPPCDFVAPPV